VIVSPGLSLDHPALLSARAAGAELIGDIELFARLVHAPVVGITGSNGKSTVTTLVGAMGAAAGISVGVGGNLGTPALDLITVPEPDYYVLELSSFQLETTTSLDATVACVLNVSPDHLDRHGTEGSYVAAKARIFHGQGAMVINADDPVVAAMILPGRRIISFTLVEPTGYDYGITCTDGRQWLARGDKRLLAVDEMRIKGLHNAQNALAALAIGSEMGLSDVAMCSVLRSFPGLPHRCAFVAEHHGIEWYNDSKGTNVGATEAALAGLLTAGRMGVLIAGGQGKGQNFSPLARAAVGRLRAAVLIGEDRALIAEALAGVVPVILQAAGLREAVAEASRLAQRGDVVLLSPACASLDQFESYAHRGRVFVSAVESLIAL
jgi:UDP-N-acetylmuramoylalanine--D-glutamate ligase